MAGMGSCRGEMRQCEERWRFGKERSQERKSGIGSGFEKIVLFVVALVMSVVVQPVTAQSMHSTSALEQGRLASLATPRSTLWMSRFIDGFGEQYFSGILMGEHQGRSWGITAGHGFELGHTFRAGNGTNRINNRGQEFNVTSFITHPTVAPGGFNGTEIDIAVFFLDGLVTGTPYPTIGSAVLNQVVSYDGFGRPGTPAGLLPGDGHRRTFQTYADFFGSFGTISTDYILGGFVSSGPRFLPLGGVMTTGNSGSGVYNSAGDLVAMSVASSGSPGYLGSTISLRLDLYQPWINSVVPSPGAASLLLLGGLLAARRRRG